MKTLLVSLAALVSVSSAALAVGGNEQRDYGTYVGKHSAQNYATDSNAITIVKSSKKKTAFERMKEISEENDLGGKGSNGAGHGNGPSV